MTDRLKPEKTFKDRWGDVHQYSTHLHDAESGFPMFWRINKMAVGLGAGALGSTDFVGGDISLRTADIDPTKLAHVLADSLDIVSDKAFIKDLLSTTIRDGEKLHNVFAHAYAGNYGELLEVIAWVIKENFLDPLWASLKPYLDVTGPRLKGALSNFLKLAESTGG
uniref:Uncharacterized protein n=1 Tax=viral metagenome TaxID=1070528 RepID=A0A6M3LNH1_9ZZZZ